MISVKDAALLLGVSKATVNRMIDRGILIPANSPSPLLMRTKAWELKKSDVERLKAESDSQS